MGYGNARGLLGFHSNPFHARTYILIDGTKEGNHPKSSKQKKRKQALRKYFFVLNPFIFRNYSYLCGQNLTVNNEKT